MSHQPSLQQAIWGRLESFHDPQIWIALAWVVSNGNCFAGVKSSTSRFLAELDWFWWLFWPWNHITYYFHCLHCYRWTATSWPFEVLDFPYVFVLIAVVWRLTTVQGHLGLIERKQNEDAASLRVTSEAHPVRWTPLWHGDFRRGLGINHVGKPYAPARGLCITCRDTYTHYHPHTTCRFTVFYPWTSLEFNILCLRNDLRIWICCSPNAGHIHSLPHYPLFGL